MSLNIGIQADNIHHGGGAVLLTALLQALPADCQGFLLVDSRYTLPEDLPPKLMIKRIKATIAARLKSQLLLTKLAKQVDSLLCFGNLPPLCKVSVPVSLFLQNRLLLPGNKSFKFTIKTRLRLWLEGFWLRFGLKNCDQLIVQTKSMYDLAQAGLSNCPKILIAPFIAVMPKLNLDSIPLKYDFIYVADHAAHKNHRTLILAWVELAKQNLKPHLALTLAVNQHNSLCSWIKQLTKQYDLNISLLGNLNANQIWQALAAAKAVIYPSLVETIGLPLIEAYQAGKPILAANLNYASDIVKPNLSFDPLSATAIARSVQLSLQQQLSAPSLSTLIVSPKDFIKLITDDMIRK